MSYKENTFILYISDNILLKDEVSFIKYALFENYDKLKAGIMHFKYNEDKEEKSKEIIEKYDKAKNDFENRYMDVLKKENQIYIAV